VSVRAFTPSPSKVTNNTEIKKEEILGGRRDAAAAWDQVVAGSNALR